MTAALIALACIMGLATVIVLAACMLSSRLSEIERLAEGD